MKMMLLVSAIATLFICTSLVCAEGGQWYLLSPRMILRLNLTDAPLVRSIGLRNTDAEPVDIIVRPPASLEGVIFFNESDLSFTLTAGEEKWVNFTVNPPKAGNYSGDVIVLFNSRNQNVTSAALASEVYVLATGEENSREEPAWPFLSVCIALAAVIAVIAAAAIFMLKRG